jgi:hypothetical protein
MQEREGWSYGVAEMAKVLDTDLYGCGGFYGLHVQIPRLLLP